MVPTLSMDDIKERIARNEKAGACDKVNKIYRKRDAESSLERRLKNKMGRTMKSAVQPKTGLEKMEKCL